MANRTLLRRFCNARQVKKVVTILGRKFGDGILVARGFSHSVSLDSPGKQQKPETEKATDLESIFSVTCRTNGDRFLL